MNYIKLFIPPIFFIILNKLKKKVEVNTNLTDNTKYIIGKYQIEIPFNHTIPQFQEANKLYDRFLPVLAKNINSNKLIIDIGANVGDTPVAMLQNCKNPLYCVEPSDFFFSFLEKNIKSLADEDRQRVKCIKSFIGTGVYQGQLVHSGGTASITCLNDNNNVDVGNYLSLDELIEDHTNVVLIKVDTDGYDFDVLKSAEKILQISEPILFWENQMFEDFQTEGFNELYSLLTDLGYKYIYIFDNFGNLIIEESNFDTLRKINSYVFSMDQGKSTRTFFYTDILAATEKNHDFVKEAIVEYKNEWINS